MGVEREQTEAQHAERHRRTDPHHPRATGTRPPDPTPQPVLFVTGGAVPRHERPERTAPSENQQRRQQRGHRDELQPMPTAATVPRPALELSRDNNRHSNAITTVP